MILHQIPQILNNNLRCTGIQILPQPLIRPNNIRQLMSQIILRPFTRFQSNRRTNSHRRNKKRSHNRTLRSQGSSINSQNLQILITNLNQPFTNLRRKQSSSTTPKRSRFLQPNLLLNNLTMRTFLPIFSFLNPRNQILSQILLIFNQSLSTSLTSRSQN